MNNEYHRNYYHTHKEKLLERQRRYRRKHFKRHLLKTAKDRAAKQKVPFTLTEEEFPDIPEVCPVFGTPLRLEATRYESSEKPSLDRFIPTEGYTKENVRIISLRANRLKSDMTLNELEKLLVYMKNEYL